MRERKAHKLGISEASVDYREMRVETFVRLKMLCGNAFFYLDRPLGDRRQKEEKVYRWGGSNPRSQACEACVLTTRRHRHSIYISTSQSIYYCPDHTSTLHVLDPTDATYFGPCIIIPPPLDSIILSSLPSHHHHHSTSMAVGRRPF